MKRAELHGVRGPRRAAFAEAIDLEINHPVYGWIPFGASPHDPEEFGRELYAAALAGEFGPVADAPHDVVGPSEPSTQGGSA